jgi:hypothetical protein
MVNREGFYKFIHKNIGNFIQFLPTLLVFKPDHCRIRGQRISGVVKINYKRITILISLKM